MSARRGHGSGALGARLALAAGGLALAAGCTSATIGEEPPTDRFHYPTGMVAHPNDPSRFYVLSANFNLEFRGGTVLEVDLRTVGERLSAAPDDPTGGGTWFSDAIRGDDAVRVDSFGGNLAALDLDPSADGERVAVFAPVRQTNGLYRVDVAGRDAARRLDCRGASPSAARGLVTCTDDARLETTADDPFDTVTGALAVPDDAGHPAGTAPFVFVSHLLRGEIVAVRADTFRATACLHTSISSMTAAAWVPPSATRPAPLLVAISRTDAALYVLDVGVLVQGADITPSCVLPAGVPVPALGARAPLPVLPFQNYPSTGYREFARGLAVSPDGKTLWAAMRAPDGLAVLDLERDPPALVDLIPLAGAPTQVAYLDNGGAGDLLYVTAADSDRVYVVDATRRAVVAVLDEVVTSPYALTLPLQLPIGGTVRRVAAVDGFRDGQVALIDLDAPPAEQRVLARIGAPLE